MTTVLDISASFVPRKLESPFDISSLLLSSLSYAVRFSLDRYKNSIATRAWEEAAATLSYLVLSAPRIGQLPGLDGRDATPLGLGFLSHFPSPSSRPARFFFCSSAHNPQSEARHRGATERFSRRVCISTYQLPICNEFLWKRWRANVKRETQRSAGILANSQLSIVLAAHLFKTDFAFLSLSLFHW